MIPSNWAMLLGFLAQRQATIYLQVLERNEREFEARFREVTGEQPQPLMGAGYSVVPATSNKYGDSSRVVFSAKDSELFIAHAHSAAWDFKSEVKVCMGQSSRQWAIYSSALVWKLLEYGFTLGTRQDTARIRKEIPEGLLEAFDQGVKLGGKT